MAKLLLNKSYKYSFVQYFFKYRSVTASGDAMEIIGFYENFFQAQRQETLRSVGSRGKQDAKQIGSKNFVNK